MVTVVLLILTFDFDGSDSWFLQTDSEDFVKDVVGQTSGFMPRDMHALIADAGASLFSKVNIPIDPNESKELNQSQRFQAESDSKSSESAPQVLGKENLTKALERSKKRNASALGTPKVSNVMMFHCCLYWTAITVCCHDVQIFLLLRRETIKVINNNNQGRICIRECYLLNTERL